MVSPPMPVPSELQITLWTRLWSWTRAQALSRIAATRQMMGFRSGDKSTAKDRKWAQVAHMWERQGIGRLEWEHWVQVGSFGANDEEFGVRGLSRGGGDARASECTSAGMRGAEDDDVDGDGEDRGYEEDGRVDTRTAFQGDVSPITTASYASTNASPTTTTIPPPPPSPYSPPYSHDRIHNATDTTADEETFQAALALVDAHGVDRGEAVAKAVWVALRAHLDCVRSGAGCTVACLVCRLIRAKFDRIVEECHGDVGGKQRHVTGDAGRHWSTMANDGRIIETSPRSTRNNESGTGAGNDASCADNSTAAQQKISAGPHELDASETTCSKRSTGSDEIFSSIQPLSGLRATSQSEQISGSASLSPAGPPPTVVFAPPSCVSSGYRSYQYEVAPAGRAVVFDPSSALHPHSGATGRRDAVSARSYSEPCLSEHTIHGNSAFTVSVSPSPSPYIYVQGPSPSPDAALVSPSSSNANANANGKASPIRALARFVGDKSKQLLPANLKLNLKIAALPRRARSSPVSPLFPSQPQSQHQHHDQHQCQMQHEQQDQSLSATGITGRRRSSYAFSFSPRLDCVRRRGRFASFSLLCSPKTVNVRADSSADSSAGAGLEERRGHPHVSKNDDDALALEQWEREQGLERDGEVDGERGSASAWSSVIGSSSAAAVAARRWARRNAGRLGGDAGVGASNSNDARKKSWKSVRSTGSLEEEVGQVGEDEKEKGKDASGLPETSRDAGAKLAQPTPHHHTVAVAVAVASAPQNLHAARHPQPPSLYFSPSSTQPPRLSLCLSLAPLALPQPVPDMPTQTQSVETGEGNGRGKERMVEG